MRRRFGVLRRREAALGQRPDEPTADLPVMLYQAEPNGELVVVSGSSSMLLGRTRGELAGRLLGDFAQETPAFAERVAPSEVGARVSDAASFSADWRHADSTLRRLHTVARAVRDPDGAAGRDPRAGATSPSSRPPSARCATARSASARSWRRRRTGSWS